MRSEALAFIGLGLPNFIWLLAIPTDWPDEAPYFEAHTFTMSIAAKRILRPFSRSRVRRGKHSSSHHDAIEPLCRAIVLSISIRSNAQHIPSGLPL